MEQRQARRILPKPPRSDLPPLAQSQYKHKRQVVSVACDRCRARKIKCDGETPPCRPCVRVNASCNYQEPRYRPKQVQKPTATSGPARPGHDGLKPPSRSLEWEGEELIDRLQVPGQQDVNARPTTPYGLPSSADQDEFPPLPISRWTSLSQDDHLMTHLLIRLWTYDNSITRIVHQDFFVQGLCMDGSLLPTANGIGRVDFCSSALVHSLLALSTLYCTDVDWAEEAAALGQSCAESSRLSLHTRDATVPSLSVFQSAVVLWIYDHATGNVASADGLSKLVYQLYTDLEDVWTASLIPASDDFVLRIHQQTSFTAWGFWFLNMKMNLMTGQFRYITQPRTTTLFTGVSPLDAAFKNQYLQRPLSISPIPGPEVFELFGDIARIASESMILLQTSGISGEEKARHLYNSLLKTRQAASQLIMLQPAASSWLVDAGVVIDMTALTILYPFSCVRALDFHCQQSASDLEIHHAVNIATALWDMRIRTGSRLDVSLLCACTSAATILLLRLNSNKTLLEPTRQLLTVCNEQKSNVYIAAQILQRLASLAKSENLWIPEDVQTMLVGEWPDQLNDQPGAAACWNGS